MADRLKDKEDTRLEALFRSEPIEDDGFSERVVSRVRRGMWIRRWTLPVAMLVGGLIAAKPTAEILLAMSEVLSAMTGGFQALPVDSLPQATLFVFGGTLVGIVALFIKGLEE